MQSAVFSILHTSCAISGALCKERHGIGARTGSNLRKATEAAILSKIKGYIALICGTIWTLPDMWQRSVTAVIICFMSSRGWPKVEASVMTTSGRGLTSSEVNSSVATLCSATVLPARAAVVLLCNRMLSMKTHPVTVQTRANGLQLACVSSTSMQGVSL